MKVQVAWRTALTASLLLQPSISTPLAASNVASLDAEYTYLLPLPFVGNLTQDFISGTSLSNQTVASSLSNAQGHPFISFSPEFDKLVGSATLETIVANTSYPFSWAGEGGIWVPDLNQVWLTSTLYGGSTTIYILFLENNTVIEPDFTAIEGYGTNIPLANPAGGYYFDDKVYICLVGDEREPASLVSLDPHTYQVTPIVNSYFGLELPPVDDAVVTYTNTRNGFQEHIVSHPRIQYQEIHL